MGLLRRRTSRASSIVAFALALTTLGCASSPPTPSVDDPGEAVGGNAGAAAQMVERWLTAASSMTGDLGWSLLYPTVRSDIVRSEEVYRRTVLAAEWHGVRPVIKDVWLSDGEYRVVVLVPGGQARVPKFMLDWGLIQFVLRDGRPTDEGLMVVRIEPIGSVAGIQASGATR